MIFPKKHLTIHESIIGLSSHIFSLLNIKEMDLDQVWESYIKINNTKKFPAKHDFDHLVIAVDILFAMKKIDFNKEGKLFLK